MRVYYLSRRTVLIMGIAAILLLGLGGLILIPNTTNPATGTNLSGPIFQGNSGQKAVAITVNVDWGEEYIPKMLEEFKKNHAQVTFFVTGKWAGKNPELLKKMAEEGHSIQNHGYKHCHFNSLGPAEVKSEIKKAEEIIYKATGQTTSYFASPYGEYNKELVNAVSNIDYRFIMWSADTIDWQRPAPATIVNRVINKVHNDSIILMHPTDLTVKALPDMLKKLSEENYKMVTIDKILVKEDQKK